MQTISKREMDFLRAETESWTEHEIISFEQAQEILSLYEVHEHSLRRILFITGGILLGLGAVSFIAAYWHQLPKLFRVCVILAGYLGSLCAYFLTGRSRTRTGQAFLLLASIIFGAGIYLITRMYNYKLEFEEVLLYWLAELAITTFIACDTWHLYFSQAVSLVYLNWINAIDLFALEFMNSSKISLSKFFLPLEGFAVLTVLWLIRFRIKDRTAVNINMLLTLLVLASRMSLCFGGTWTLIILVLAGAAMSFSRFNDTEIIGLLVAGLCGLLLTWPEVWRGSLASWGNILAVVSALITACVMIINIWRGHNAIGIIFCSLLVVRYFFDRLFGYMPKAWGFTLIGVVFIGCGLFFEKLRRIFMKEE